MVRPVTIEARCTLFQGDVREEERAVPERNHRIINRKDIERLSVLIPPKSIIQRFNDCIKPIDDSIEIACKEIVSLSYSRDSLLPKLMSGQLTFDALDC